jgi:hypothetical protein
MILYSLITPSTTNIYIFSKNKIGYQVVAPQQKPMSDQRGKEEVADRREERSLWREERKEIQCGLVYDKIYGFI